LFVRASLDAADLLFERDALVGLPVGRNARIAENGHILLLARARRQDVGCAADVVMSISVTP